MSTFSRAIPRSCTSALRQTCDSESPQHKNHGVAGFTKRYNVDRLVYFEEYSEAIVAIEREKRLKRMTRPKKTALIRRSNPDWRDLADEL